MYVTSIVNGYKIRMPKDFLIDVDDSTSGRRAGFADTSIFPNGFPGWYKTSEDALSYLVHRFTHGYITQEMLDKQDITIRRIPGGPAALKKLKDDTTKEYFRMHNEDMVLQNILDPKAALSPAEHTTHVSEPSEVEPESDSMDIKIGQRYKRVIGDTSSVKLGAVTTVMREVYEDKVWFKSNSSGRDVYASLESFRKCFIEYNETEQNTKINVGQCYTRNIGPYESIHCRVDKVTKQDDVKYTWLDNNKEEALPIETFLQEWTLDDLAVEGRRVYNIHIDQAATVLEVNSTSVKVLVNGDDYPRIYLPVHFHSRFIPAEYKE